eukprot:861654_1
MDDVLKLFKTSKKRKIVEVDAATKIQQKRKLVYFDDANGSPVSWAFGVLKRPATFSPIGPRRPLARAPWLQYGTAAADALMIEDRPKKNEVATQTELGVACEPESLSSSDP